MVLPPILCYCRDIRCFPRLLVFAFLRWGPFWPSCPYIFYCWDVRCVPQLLVFCLTAVGALLALPPILCQCWDVHCFPRLLIFYLTAGRPFRPSRLSYYLLGRGFPQNAAALGCCWGRAAWSPVPHTSRLVITCLGWDQSLSPLPVLHLNINSVYQGVHLPS